MQSKSFLSILVIVAFIPVNLMAEHDCVEEIDEGQVIKVQERFPAKWLLVGKQSISDSEFHASLRSKYKQHYTETDDEGPVGHFCAHQGGGFLNIATSGFGPSVEYSTVGAKYWKCNPIKADIAHLKSGTGLRIGMMKPRASALLKSKTERDITTITFEEIEKGKKNKIWHSQTLRLVFQSGKLIRFSVNDYRETYD